MNIVFLKEFESKLEKYILSLEKNNEIDVIEFIASKIKLHLAAACRILSDNNGTKDYMVLDFIKKNGTVKKAHITYSLQSVGNSNYLNKILDELVASDKIKCERIGKKTIYTFLS